MNAIQFIQQHGVDKAREVVAAYHGIPSYTFKEKTGRGYSACQSVDLSDLKRLVDSLDLVKSYGGIINAKYDVKYLDLDWDYDTPRVTRLKQAIADYESIYGGDHV